MKIRAIPFGYKYDVGQIIVDETAACIVKEIFSQYVDGKSLLNISSLLNTMCIEYRPGVVGWNKARVKRIIEDKRYLGTEDFPTIISEELAEKANNIKAKKNTRINIDQSNLIYSLDAPVRCPCCGDVMKRIYEPRNKIPERWRCENEDCHRIIPKSDSDLLMEIQLLINSLISNPDLITSSHTDNTVSMETHRIENEFNHMLDSRNINKDEIKAKLFELISHKYSDLNTSEYESRRLKDVFRSQKPFSEFPTELFNQTANTISFDDSENVVITLISGQIIRKESHHGAAEEDSCHCADSQRQRRCPKQVPTEACSSVLPSIHTAGRTA